MKHTTYIIFLFVVLLSCNNKPKGEIKITELQGEQTADSIIKYDTVMFNFEPDVRLFTTMSFANISGYDSENTTMTKERLEIRSYLDSVLTSDFKEKISGLSKKELFASFGSKAFSLTYPPTFTWLADSLSLTNTPRKDENYAALLTEFYTLAKISDLWKKYEEKFRAENYAYIPYSTKGIEDIIDFCRVKKDYFANKQFVFNICPIMQNQSGFTCYSKTKVFIVVSPRESEPSPKVFYHEVLHHIINPLVDDNSDKLIAIRAIGRVGFNVRMKEMRGCYLGISGLFSECMVRAIDYILQEDYFKWSKETVQKKIDKQYHSGLTLIPYFYEKLTEYKETSMTLEAYLPIIIQGIDVEREKLRWNNFQKNERSIAHKN